MPQKKRSRIGMFFVLLYLGVSIILIAPVLIANLRGEEVGFGIVVAFYPIMPLSSLLDFFGFRFSLGGNLIINYSLYLAITVFILYYLGAGIEYLLGRTRARFTERPETPPDTSPPG